MTWGPAMGIPRKNAPQPGTAGRGVRKKGAYQRLLGKLNTAPSRTPAEGQRWVMVLRLV